MDPENGGIVFCLAALLFIAAGLCVLGGYIWVALLAGQENPLLGFLCIFVPGVYLYFVATRWSLAKKPMLLHGMGILLLLMAAMISSLG